MITSNSLMFVPKANMKKEANNYAKTNGRDKKGAFEEILNQKKDIIDYKSSSGLNNPRASLVNQQNLSIKEKQSKNIAINDKVKDKNITLGKQNKDNKTNDENTDLTLEENNEKNDLNSTYDYLNLHLLNTINSEKIQGLEGVIEGLAETQLANESFASIIEGNAIEENTVLEHSYEGMINSAETGELFELVELYEQNNETIVKSDKQIGEASLTEKENTLFTVDTEMPGETIDEEFKSDSLFPKMHGSDATQELQQATDSESKTGHDEKNDALINGSEGKEPLENDELKLNDDVNIQNSIEVKEQNILSQFTENNYNLSGKNFENNLDDPLYDKNIRLNKDDIFEQIVEKVKINIDKTDEIRIKLKPDFLGEISLKLVTEKGVITAKAYVENYNIKQLIESNLDSLKENMKGLGLNFEALDVSVGKDSGFDKNNGQAWKQSQRVKTKKLSIEKISGSLTYEEDIRQIAGGLYSAEGNIDLIV